MGTWGRSRKLNEEGLFRPLNSTIGKAFHLRLDAPRRPARCARNRTVDDDLNSINAMTPDPNTLMAINANNCTSGAPLNIHTLIASLSLCKIPAPTHKRPLPEGMMCIRGD
jgi:hypothetical protein